MEISTPDRNHNPSGGHLSSVPTATRSASLPPSLSLRVGHPELPRCRGNPQAPREAFVRSRTALLTRASPGGTQTSVTPQGLGEEGGSGHPEAFERFGQNASSCCPDQHHQQVTHELAARGNFVGRSKTLPPTTLKAPLGSERIDAIVT